MKTNYISLGILSLVLLTLFSLKVFQQNHGPHDGIIQEADEYLIEMKSDASMFYTCLLDKSFNPLGNKNMLCKVKFIYSDSTSMDIELKPYGTDGFWTSKSVIDYTNCRIFYTLQGRTISALFDNPNPIATKNQKP